MKKSAQLIIYLIVVLILITIVACSTNTGPKIHGGKMREYANVLYNRELYEQSIQVYQKYLDYYSVDENMQANINYTIANMYFERLHDYQNALAYYLKVRHLYPENQIDKQVSKQIVACLERLGQSADAKQALDEAAHVDPDQLEESRPGQVIAKIGDREITTGDLTFYIGQLPEYMQSQINTKETKLEFLKQFVATELFYDAAKRKGLDKDKEVIEGVFQAKKSLMVQKHLQEEITQQIKLTEDDVRLYYEAHKDKYAEKDEDGHLIRQRSLQEVQQQVTQDYLQQRQQKITQKLLEQNLSAENVVIYDDLIN